MDDPESRKYAITNVGFGELDVVERKFKKGQNEK